MGVAAIGLLLPTASAGAKSVTVSGVVRCPANAPVVGVWVKSSGGGSKFASLFIKAGKARSNGYSAKVGSGKVELHVGCGGSAESWDSDQWTKKMSISKSRALNAICGGDAGTFGKVTCSFPARPNKIDRPNTFAAGNCTWYAAEKWRGASGRNPSWMGNAKDWNNNASKERWTVLSTPAPRSVVVFEPGVQKADEEAGHVAWVKSVEYKNGSWYLNVSEMNFVAPGAVTPRTVKHVAGMSYIWAPG